MFNKIFDNISDKLRIFSKFIFIPSIFTPIICGIVIMLKVPIPWKELNTVLGLFMILVLPIFSWLSCLLIYGFAELIDASASNELIRHIAKLQNDKRESNIDNFNTLNNNTSQSNVAQVGTKAQLEKKEPKMDISICSNTTIDSTSKRIENNTQFEKSPPKYFQSKL